MKFGIFYEHQLPRPWNDGDEQQLFNDALEQVEVADRLGIDFAWEVEHHFLALSIVNTSSVAAEGS